MTRVCRRFSILHVTRALTNWRSSYGDRLQVQGADQEQGSEQDPEEAEQEVKHCFPEVQGQEVYEEEKVRNPRTTIISY